MKLPKAAFESYCSHTYLLSITILLALILLLIRRQLKKPSTPLAPQPSGLPILGNLHQFITAATRNELHLLVQKWHQELGDVIRVNLGFVTTHFVASDVGVKAIFDRNSAFTAERPRWIYSNEVHCGGLNVLLLDASQPRWKHQRKVIHSNLTSAGMADKGLPYLHYETAKFLDQMAGDPQAAADSHQLFDAIGRYTYSTFAQQTFGMEISQLRDPVINYIFNTGEQQIQGTLPGSYLVDIFPILNRLPNFLKPWHRTGRARFLADFAWTSERLSTVRRDIANGFFHDAFLPRVLHDEKSLGFATEEEAAYLSLMLIIGAADTSRLSTWSFLEAMMLHPHVQTRLQREIDQVVGDRIPVFEDLEAIPYVRCVMKETWRWRPPVTLGHPHRVTKDLMYNGYLLPAGSRVQINAWAIGHDGRRHADPEAFTPERFENDTSSTMESINAADPSKRDHFAFGAGRRVCPGYHVADRSLAVAIMRIMWAFDANPAGGEMLRPAEYAGFMPGVAGERMPVKLVVRDERKRELIREEMLSEQGRHLAMRDLGTMQ